MARASAGGRREAAQARGGSIDAGGRREAAQAGGRSTDVGGRQEVGGEPSSGRESGNELGNNDASAKFETNPKLG